MIPTLNFAHHVRHVHQQFVKKKYDSATKDSLATLQLCNRLQFLISFLNGNLKNMIGFAGNVRNFNKGFANICHWITPWDFVQSC